MSETPLQNKAIELAEMAGWLCRKAAWRGRIGCPDVVFIKGGRTVWIEFKKPFSEETARFTQSLEHDRMDDAGAEVHVVDSLREAKRILGL